MDISIKTAGKIEDYINQYFEHSLIGMCEENIEKIIENEKATIPKFYYLKSKLHPLSFWIYDYRKVLAKIKKDNRLAISKNFMRLVFLIDSMSECKDIDNFRRFKKPLKTRNKFLGTVLEINTAAKYKKEGFKIKIIEETPQGGEGGKGEKKPDFALIFGDKKVIIECKDLEDAVDKAKGQWSSLVNISINTMKKYRRALRVDIDINKRNQSNMKDMIIQIVKEDIRNNTIKNKSIDGIDIRYEKLMKWDEPVRNPPKIKNENRNAILNYSITINPQNPNTIYNLCLASVNINFSYDFSKDILMAIKKARKQIPEKNSSILHINIPTNNIDDFIRIIDESYGAIYNKITGSTSKINLVVFSAQLLDWNSPKPLRYEEYYIYNIAAKTKLPKEFLEKRTSYNDQINRDSGILVIKGLKIDKDYLKADLINIYLYLSSDGAYQIKLFWTKVGGLQLDFINPSFGRKTIKQSYPRLSLEGNHELILRWSRDIISFVFDCKEIESSHFPN